MTLSELCGASVVENSDAGISPALEVTMEGEVVSVFWVLAAFIVGGFCGVLVMALMSLSRGLPKQSPRAVKEELHGLDLGGSTNV
jgi:hypothetical protein